MIGAGMIPLMLFGFAQAPPDSLRSGLVVAVRAEASGAPIIAATVSSRRLGIARRTDRLGLVRFPELVPPDTLRVVAIGYLVKEVVVRGIEGVTEVRLALAPFLLPNVEVTGTVGQSAAPGVGISNISRRELQQSPPAVQNDPLRALAQVPAVSFSTPLSARPMIRGYDATETVVTLDGFELVNPYHIGRAFSNLPLDAVESIEVSPAPFEPRLGGLAGVISITGRQSGLATGQKSGAEISPVSASAWHGTTGRLRSHLVARAAYLDALTGLIGDKIAYGFQDLYGRVELPLTGGRSVGATVFGSRDRLGRFGSGQAMTWSNVLVGQRTRLFDGPSGRLDISASHNRFELKGAEVVARSSQVGLDNHFVRTGVEAEAERYLGKVRLLGGLTATHRTIRSALTTLPGSDVPSFTNQSRVLEWQAHASARLEVPRLTAEAGVRIDRAGGVGVVQPRASVSVRAGPNQTVRLAYARAGRVVQVISEALQEPGTAFYEYWLAAGTDGVPTPVIDHLVASATMTSDKFEADLALFGSRGRRLGELRPVTDQRRGLSLNRFGESATIGAEIGVKWSAPSLANAVIRASFSAMQSVRRWDSTNWVPWRVDRRIRSRFQVALWPAKRLEFTGAMDFATGLPLTPVQGVVFRQRVPLDEAGLGDRSAPAYLYAAEGSRRGRGTWQIDLAARYAFRGPGRSQMYLGGSLTNVTFGPVAPDVPDSPGLLVKGDGTFSQDGVHYNRLFDLPIIPSVTLRIEF